MAPAASRKWEFAVVGLIFLIASYVLFVPPIVGVADQGDYSRVTTHVGLTYLPGISYIDQFNCWLVTHWKIVSPEPSPVFSTAELPIRAIISLHRVATRDTTLDIRWVAGAYLALLLSLILATLDSARRLPVPAYLVIAVGLIVVCTDSEYISYFNSFFTEPAALLGVLAFVAAGLAAVTAVSPSWRHMLLLVLGAAFLVGSKAQNAVLGVFAACWMVWLFKDNRAKRYASIVAGLVLVWFCSLILSLAPLPQSNLFNTIYAQVILIAPNPKGALVELGLKPETTAWAGQAYWNVKIPSADLYPGKASRFRLLLFYLRHPDIDLQLASGGLTLSNDVEGMGNFPRNSGAPHSARTQVFTGYDRLRTHLASIWFVFPLLAANFAAVFIWRSRGASLISTLAAMAVMAFLIGALYDSEPRKHLFTFNLLFDVVLFADLSVAAVRVARMGPSLPVFGSLGRMLVTLFLVLILGFALRLEVFPNGFLKRVPVFNLAMGKTATQSSTLSDYATTGPAGAVDSDTDGNFFHGSVTHTKVDSNAWWQVDLGSSTTVNTIIVWNRTDCCRDRLKDYWVFVSDTGFGATDTPATLRDRAGTFSTHETSAPSPFVTIRTGGVRGRYVRVQLAGKGYLSLSEVQVSVFGPDLALGKPTTQSSTAPGYPGYSATGPAGAVDGNVSGSFFHDSVTHTNLDPNAWWEVDLGASEALGSIVVWNRTDCCSSRLEDYWVFVSDTPFAATDTPATLQYRRGIFSTHQTSAPYPSATIRAAGVKGRYVRVQLAGKGYLSLAEVQVFGQ